MPPVWWRHSSGRDSGGHGFWWPLDPRSHKKGQPGAVFPVIPSPSCLACPVAREREDAPCCLESAGLLEPQYLNPYNHCKNQGDRQLWNCHLPLFCPRPIVSTGCVRCDLTAEARQRALPHRSPSGHQAHNDCGQMNVCASYACLHMFLVCTWKHGVKRCSFLCKKILESTYTRGS